MNGKGQRVRALFREISGVYDGMNALMSLGMDTRWRRLLVDRSSVSGSDKVLDICCGTGDVAFEAAGRLDKGGSVVGMDFTPEMLAIAREKAARRGLVSAVRFDQGDAMALPYPDGSFDAVTVAFGIRNVEDIPTALREVHRVLRVDGRFACLDLSKPSIPGFKQAYDLYFGTLVPLAGRWIHGRKGPYDYLPESLVEFPVRDALAGLVSGAGFRNVGFDELALGAAAIHYGIKGIDG